MGNPHDMRAPVPFDLEFDGRACNIIPLQAKKAREVATKIQLVLSRAMKEATSTARDGKLPRSKEEAKVAAALHEALSTATIMEHLAAADMLDWLTGKFLDSSEVERTLEGGGDFVPLRQYEDLLFSGAGMGRWLRWLRACIEVNCGGFFAELQRQQLQLMTKTTGSPTPTESPSPSNS